MFGLLLWHFPFTPSIWIWTPNEHLWLLFCYWLICILTIMLPLDKILDISESFLQTNICVSHCVLVMNKEYPYLKFVWRPVSFCTGYERRVSMFETSINEDQSYFVQSWCIHTNLIYSGDETPDYTATRQKQQIVCLRYWTFAGQSFS